MNTCPALRNLVPGLRRRSVCFPGEEPVSFFQMNSRMFRWKRWLGAGAVAWLCAVPAPAFESLTFDLPSGAKESFWRDELARRWQGRTEQAIEGGRIDVLTDREAVEVEFPHKWHEGIGQALHYASATGKQGVLAVIAYARGEENLRTRSRNQLELIARQCQTDGIRMVVLFPNRAEEFAHNGRPVADGPPRYWLSGESGVRHNDECVYFGKSKGRLCGPHEGRPCKDCGG